MEAFIAIFCPYAAHSRALSMQISGQLHRLLVRDRIPLQALIDLFPATAQDMSLPLQGQQALNIASKHPFQFRQWHVKRHHTCSHNNHFVFLLRLHYHRQLLEILCLALLGSRNSSSRAFRSLHEAHNLHSLFQMMAAKVKSQSNQSIVFNL